MGAPQVFAHRTLGQRVVFDAGNGAARLADEVARLGATRIMLLATPGEQRRSGHVLSGVEPTLIYPEVQQHVPVENVDSARGAALDADVDLLVSLGGGSATGLAKAVAIDTGLPIVAVPTTYAGSEATNVWGTTRGGRKTTGIDDRALPTTVVYDASLTLTLPLDLSVSSGVNALAHGIDAMWAPSANPISTALAAEGIRALAVSLRGLVHDPADIESRQGLLYGTYMAATAFAAAGSGMHHKICHILGGRYDLPHAHTHTAVLPHVLAFNAATAPEAAARIAEALGARNATAGLDNLYTDIGAPRALRDHGFTDRDVDEAAELVHPHIPASNPRAVTIEDLRHLLHAVSVGSRPAS